MREILERRGVRSFRNTPEPDGGSCRGCAPRRPASWITEPFDADWHRELDAKMHYMVMGFNDNEYIDQLSRQIYTLSTLFSLQLKTLEGNMESERQHIELINTLLAGELAMAEKAAAEAHQPHQETGARRHESAAGRRRDVIRLSGLRLPPGSTAAEMRAAAARALHIAPADILEMHIARLSVDARRGPGHGPGVPRCWWPVQTSRPCWPAAGPKTSASMKRRPMSCRKTGDAAPCRPWWWAWGPPGSSPR
jgi:hypothetical protein